jgi:hypothetical protein
VKNNSLGFILLNIQNNELYDQLLQQIANLIKNNPYYNIVIFTNNSDIIATHNVPILHLNHAKFFNGNLWLFDLVSVILTQKFTNFNKRIFYVNDMPWIKNRKNSYYEWNKIYNSDIDFVCSNQYLYDIYNVCWKKPLDVMESFNHEKVQSIIRSIN